MVTHGKPNAASPRAWAIPGIQCIVRQLKRLALLRAGRGEPRLPQTSAQKPHGRFVGLIDRAQVALAPPCCQMFPHVYARGL